MTCKKEDLSGKIFGRLKVLDEAKPKLQKSGRKRIRWNCICECGKTKDILAMSLKSGDTRSCGCLSIEASTKHGLKKHKLYHKWIDVKNRCNNKNYEKYGNWGGRGIKVCKEWEHDFKSFFDFCIKNGWKEGLQIDRIDNDGDYEPSNCRFVTNRVNSLNKSRLNKNNKSGYTGVHWDKHKRKWIAQIVIKSKRQLIGQFDKKLNAVKARNDFIIKNKLKHEYKIQTT